MKIIRTTIFPVPGAELRNTLETFVPSQIEVLLSVLVPSHCPQEEGATQQLWGFSETTSSSQQVSGGPQIFAGWICSLLISFDLAHIYSSKPGRKSKRKAAKRRTEVWVNEQWHHLYQARAKGNQENFIATNLLFSELLVQFKSIAVGGLTPIP